VGERRRPDAARRQAQIALADAGHGQHGEEQRHDDHGVAGAVIDAGP
jgi:hypothetical protein